jgi:hypothetical protein
MGGVWRVLPLLLATAWLGQTGSQPAAPATQAQTAASAPVQPIPFSHKLHAGTLHMPCQYCHAPSPSGDTLRIPQAAACMQCHQTADTGNPSIQKLAAYAQTGTTIPWVRIYQLPSFVTFSHKVHLEHGSTCQECHGSVAQQDRIYKESDISMAGCINCHRAKRAPVDCDTCHMLDQ